MACATILLLGVTAPALAQSTLQYVPVISNYAGLASTVCSTAADSEGNGCPATQAQFSGPFGSTTDAAGNLYVSDSSDNVIRRIDAKTGIITLIAGGASSVCSTAATDKVGDGCPATQATLNAPRGLRFDPFGNLVVADSSNQRVRSINMQTGVITSIAGTGSTASAVPSNTSPTVSGKTAIAYPYDIAFDAQGNMYIANYKTVSNIAVVAAINGAIDPANSLIYNLAGTGTNGATGVPGPATAGQVSGPHALAMDAAGNIYVGDYSDDTIRMITSPLVNGTLNVANSVMTIIAGQSGKAEGAGPATGEGGPASGATFAGIQGVAMDAAGNLYIMQASNNVNRISKIDTGSDIHTYASSTGTKDTTGINGANGPALAAEVGGPTWGSFDREGHLFSTAQYSFNIYAISLNNNFPFSALAGTGTTQNLAVQASQALTLQATAVSPSSEFTIGTLSGCSLNDSLAASAYCVLPVTFNPSLPGLRTARLTVTDSNSNASSIGLSGVGVAPEVTFGNSTLSTIAGTGVAGNSGATGSAVAAQISAPRGGVFDATGNLYFADSGNHEIRRVDHSTGAISTVAGTGTSGFSGDGGAATAAQLDAPTNVILDAAGNLYIADSGNHRIRYVSASTGTITTLAGTGTPGYTGDGGLATAATLNNPQGLAVDGNGSVYVADTGNNVIRQFYPGSAITTLVGTGTAGYAGDGGPQGFAELNAPGAIAFDLNGNLFIADTGNSVIRMVSTLGQISTYAGKQGVNQNDGDGGAATAAALQNPSDIALDPAGDLYIASGGEVRMVNAAGTISTVAGTGASGSYSGEGGAAASAVLPAPVSNLTLDGSANLYLFATAANRVLRIASTTAPTLNFAISKSVPTSDPQLVTVQNTGNSPLSFSNISASSSYILQPSVTNACTTTTALAPGQTCVVSVEFSSTTTGTIPGTITLTDNALNAAAATQTIQLVGISGALSHTTTALTITPTSGIYGTPVTATATVSGGSAPTGTVTFTVNGTTIGSNTLTNGSATITLNALPVGTYPIVANYPGDANNTPSTGSATGPVTITPATLSVTATNVTREKGDNNPSFTYTISGFVNGESTSVVSGTPVETTTATPDSPVGSYPIQITQGTLSASNYVFTFRDGNLTVTAPTPDFSIASSSTSLAVNAGQATAVTITLTPLHTYAGTATLSCGNLPAHVVCTFNTTQLTTDSTASPQSTQLTIGTDSQSRIAQGETPELWRGHTGTVLSAIGIPFLSLGVFLAGRKRQRKLRVLLSLSVLCLFAGGLTSCSGTSNPLAAAGTYNITVTATDATQQITHSANITLVIQ